MKKEIFVIIFIVSVSYSWSIKTDDHERKSPATVQLSIAKSELGIYLFNTITKISESKESFKSRLISIEELRNFSKIDTLPVQSKTLKEVFLVTEELYDMEIVNYEKLSEVFKTFGFSMPSEFSYVDSRQYYFIDTPSKSQVEAGEKYGDDLPCTVVTLIFKYNSKQYSMEGAYLYTQSGYHLARIKTRIKEL